MKRCVILAAAPVEDYSIITSALFPDDYIICADGGALHAQKLGRTPDLAVGDFDSCRPEDINAEKKIFPREKDDTDFMLAAYEGLARGYRDFLAFGATGGSRTDHTFGAYAAAAYLAENGASVELRDEKCTIYALCGANWSFPNRRGIYQYSHGAAAQRESLPPVQNIISQISPCGPIIRWA